MARKLVAVEISLVECTLTKTLSGRKKESSHLVQSSLLWPRAGIAVRKSNSKVDLVAGQCDLREESWTRRIVFKESVESTFGIRVDMTEAIGSEALEEFLRFMAGTVMGIGADLFEDAAPGGAIISAPVEYFAKKVKKMPEADLIATGSLDVSVDEIPAKGERLYTISLFSPRDVIKRSRRTVNRKTKVTRKVLMKKDEPNGELTLSIKRI